MKVVKKIFENETGFQINKRLLEKICEAILLSFSALQQKKMIKPICSLIICKVCTQDIRWNKNTKAAQCIQTLAEKKFKKI